MLSRSFQSVLVLSAIAIGGPVTGSQAQRRAPDQQPAKQAIQVSLRIGGQSYDSSEPGRCTHAPQASIYQVVSELWSVQQSDGDQSVSLTFWRPKPGAGDMITLSVRRGNVAHEVNTVRGGTITGSGKVTLEKVGKGGTFAIDARTQAGIPIAGTIKCDTFAPHVAEGGVRNSSSSLGSARSSP